MKIAIVTGVLGGIGKESALWLCRAGYSVVGMDVIDTVEIPDFDGYDFTYVKGNLSDAASRQTLVDTATQKGEISVLSTWRELRPRFAATFWR